MKVRALVSRVRTARSTTNGVVQFVSIAKLVNMVLGISTQSHTANPAHLANMLIACPVTPARHANPVQLVSTDKVVTEEVS
jgi:hypothetical protein